MEAVNLLYTLFETDNFTRAKAIFLLRPKLMGEDEFLIYRICHKIILLVQTVENLFMFIDSSQIGFLPKSQLFEGLRKTLEIFLSEQDLNILASLLDQKTQTLSL